MYRSEGLRPELTLLPAQLPELDRIFEATQLRLAEVSEQEVFARGEFADDVSGQDLPHLRVVADARGEVDRCAEQIGATLWVALGNWLTCLLPAVYPRRGADPRYARGAILGLIVQYGA